MEWIKLLVGFLKEVLPTVTSFIVGRKSKELENVKDENEKLEKYRDIESESISSDDVYYAELWK